MRTRAVDSHVAIVAAVNGGRSCIVSGSGKNLDKNKEWKEKPGGIVQATVDLNASVMNGTGRTIQERYNLIRRPETCMPLTNYIWDYK